MEMAVFERALQFLQRSNAREVRLLGGEPTLHPDFSAMLDRALGCGLAVSVFSNGIMPGTALDRLEASEDQVSVLINASPLEAYEAPDRESLVSCLRRIGSRIQLGVNIHNATTPIDFALDWIDDFGLVRGLRLGLAHACTSRANAFLMPQEFSRVGRRILELAERARASQIRLELDCGFVPCMFPSGALEEVGLSSQAVGRRCTPIVDVLPSGDVVPCLPLAFVAREPLPERRDRQWLRRRFAGKLRLYRSTGVFAECATCLYQRESQCYGGCLATAMRLLQPADALPEQ